jgi:hypothetical protein
VRPVWALYASTLIVISQRFFSLNISWDFDFLGKVIRKRGKFTVDIPSVGDRRVIDICLTLITSNPRFTNPSQMSSAGVETGSYRIKVIIGFWDSG